MQTVTQVQKKFPNMKDKIWHVDYNSIPIVTGFQLITVTCTAQKDATFTQHQVLGLVVPARILCKNPILCQTPELKVVCSNRG
jgi:hypothetical protein